MTVPAEDRPRLPFPLRRGATRARGWPGPPTSRAIGGLLAGVTKAPPPSRWDHSEAISGSGGVGWEEGPRCILGFVVRLQSCSQRAGPPDAENYTSQQRRGKRGEGVCVTWARGLGGLILSTAAAAAAAARGTGAFCSERLWGAPERRSRRPSPARSVPASPRGGGGHPLGRASPRAPPPRPRPAPPGLRGGTGRASPRGPATSGVAATPSLARRSRLPLAPQADAMKIKDAKKPCKRGVGAAGVGGRRAASASAGRVACFPAARGAEAPPSSGFEVAVRPPRGARSAAPAPSPRRRLRVWEVHGGGLVPVSRPGASWCPESGWTEVVTLRTRGLCRPLSLISAPLLVPVKPRGALEVVTLAVFRAFKGTCVSPAVGCVCPGSTCVRISAG
jgi:hypothetical protein